MPSSRTIFAALIAITFLITGCGSNSINGQVTNDAGEPLEAVAVTIVNTRYEAETQADGSYEIEYFPGKLAITFSKDHHRSETIELDLSQGGEYPLKTIKLAQLTTQTPDDLAQLIVDSLIDNNYQAYVEAVFPPRDELVSWIEESADPDKRDKIIAEINKVYNDRRDEVLGSWHNIKAKHNDWSMAQLQRVEPELDSEAGIQTADINAFVSFGSHTIRLKLHDCAFLGGQWFMFDDMLWYSDQP